MCVCERERESVRVCVRESVTPEDISTRSECETESNISCVCVCVCERERECVCDRESVTPEDISTRRECETESNISVDDTFRARESP